MLQGIPPLMTEIQPQLMVEAAQGGKRDVLPASGDWAMHMPDKQMTDAMLFESFSEGCTVIQHDFVRRSEALMATGPFGIEDSVPPGRRASIG